MPKRVKVPRASLAVTMLDDPEFIGLCQTPEGREAFALFCALLMAAKSQENDGKFGPHEAVTAMIVRWPLDAYRRALDHITANTNWLTVHGDGSYVIRSFKKWNAWGGARPNSGPKNDASVGSSVVQDGFKMGSNVATPVSVSVTDSKDKNSSASQKPKRVEYSSDFEQFWNFVPSDKKTGKGAAYKVWVKMNAEDRAKAIDRMEWTGGCFQALDPDKQRIQFLKDPQGWLSGRKFEDADEAVKMLARGK